MSPQPGLPELVATLSGSGTVTIMLQGQNVCELAGKTLFPSLRDASGNVLSHTGAIGFSYDDPPAVCAGDPAGTSVRPKGSLPPDAKACISLSQGGTPVLCDAIGVL